jgi:hypothetical protein
MPFIVPYPSIKLTSSLYHRTVHPTVLKNKRIHAAISPLQIPRKNIFF